MAEFKAGDRVVKMSGIKAGKYGTVNGVLGNGTLNVTFDGERIPKYCDPNRCGQVATNAKFKVGDRVKVIGADNVIDEMAIGEVAKVTRILRDGLYWISGSGFAGAFKEGVLQAANSRAANARCEAGDYIEIKGGGQDTVKRVVGDKVYLKSGEVISMSDVKAVLNAARNAVARNAGRFELVEHNMGRSFGVYDSATSGYIADDIPLRDALRILKTKGETAEQAKKDLDWTDPAAIDRLW